MSHYHDEAIAEELGHGLENTFHRAWLVALRRFVRLKGMIKPRFGGGIFDMLDSLEWDLRFDEVYRPDKFIDESVSERERFYAINAACERMVG